MTITDDPRARAHEGAAVTGMLVRAPSQRGASTVNM